MDVQYTDSTTVYYTKYSRNAKAVGVMWGIFTVCYAIIAVIVFIQPQWIGDTDYTQGSGYFGLYQACRLENSGQVNTCVGSLADFPSIISDSFKAATVFVGVGVLLIFVCILMFLLFFCVSASKVYLSCGVVQLFSALCMMLGCVIYPAGWDQTQVISVCGPDAGSFALGDCMIRWAYILAIIGFFDALILATLAFVLSNRQAKYPSNMAYNGHLTKSELNGYAIETESKPSMIIQPVMTVPEAALDRYSEYSHPRSRRDFSL